ncbi:MAG: ComEC/Rec2 family competence protein [Limnothrix sp.]
MNPNRGAILCLGYIFGLFLTSFWGGINSDPSVFQWVTIVGAIAVVTSLSAWILPRHFWQFRAQFWLTVGLIALLAVGYFQIRTPRLEASPLYALTQTESSILKYPLQITGKVLNQPQFKQDGKSRFWLKTQTITTKYNVFSTKDKLYTTLSNAPMDLKSGDVVTLKGYVYQPKSNQDPWGFDFTKYLQKNNSFFSFSSWESQNLNQPNWHVSAIRERIKNTHQQFLDQDTGSLLSSMVLGRKATNLSAEINSLWRKAGLSYTIAASGFHVSILLGAIQWLTKKRSTKIQLVFGIGILFFYILLTGFQPSILRAALMGIAGLIALALDRKIKPISLLLLAATFLLICNPVWIWDLGFQLSFLAMFGLFTTLEPIIKKLDFVPPTIATAIAIPIAASLWTLPLIAYHFNIVATYCIPTSIILSPLILIVSLGGMISGAVGLVIPILGGAIAYLVGIPLRWMMWFVERVVELPGSNLSVASLHWSQLALIYGVMLIIWLTAWGKKHSQKLSISLLILFISFAVVKHFTTTQLTILGTQNEPIVVVQSSGKVLIFAQEYSSAGEFDLIPFLQQEGISKVEVLITKNAAQNGSPESTVSNNIKIKETFIFPANNLSENSQALEPFKPIKLGNINIQLLQESPSLLSIRIGQQFFYVLGDRQTKEDPLPTLNQGYLIMNPKNIDLELWETLRPQVAIAIGSSQGHFLAPNTIVYWTEEDGSIQWTPQHGLSTLAPDRN